LAAAAVVVSALVAGTVLLLNQAVGPGWFCLAVAGLSAASLTLRR
jgi:hypothetical protein